MKPDHLEKKEVEVASRRPRHKDKQTAPSAAALSITNSSHDVCKETSQSRIKFCRGASALDWYQ